MNDPAPEKRNQFPDHFRELTEQEIDAMDALQEKRAREAEHEEALRALILQKIQGSVWHTTNSGRLRGILRAGAILPEPDIDDRDRWSTSQGREWYPYVRTLGGVSLFDFREFDRQDYSQNYPLSSWSEFVPYRRAWREAVWIEIDISKLGETFISGVDLLQRWKAEEALKHRIMPKIEAAHLGPVPLTAFKNLYEVREGVHAFTSIEPERWQSD